MISRAELKQMSKEQIKGNLGILFLAGLVPVAILAILSIVMPIMRLLFSNGVGIYFFIIIFIILYFAFVLSFPAFTVGYLKMYLSISNGVKPEIRTFFDGFNIFGKSLLLAIIQSFFVGLWTLLFYIPGIIKSISYSMSFFILAEKPYLTAREALAESKEIMYCHKMDLFVLGLSFIGWMLFCVITLGLGYIYVIPYMYTTFTNFYNKIK